MHHALEHLTKPQPQSPNMHFQSSQSNNFASFRRSNSSKTFSEFHISPIELGIINELRSTAEQSNSACFSSPRTWQLLHNRSFRGTLDHLPVSMGKWWDPKRNLIMSSLRLWTLTRNGEVWSSGFMSLYILYLYWLLSTHLFNFTLTSSDALL